MAVVVLAVHALVVSTGNHVPQVANDAVGEEALAVFVEVETQGLVVPWQTTSKVLRVG